MKLLIAALAAIGAVAAGVFFWRTYHKSGEAAFNEATHSISGWSKVAADKASETTDKLAETAADAADEFAATAHRATNAASGAPDEARGASSE